MSETSHLASGNAYVSELEHWLEEHGERLDSIARRTSASASLVHLAAVLVLNGLTDQQIHDQFMVLEPRLADEHRPLEPVWAALPLIRDLEAADGGRERPSGGKKRGGHHDPT